MIGTSTRTPTSMYCADEGGDLSLGQSFAVEFMATHWTIRPMSLLLSPTSEYLFDEQNCHSFGNLPANEDQGLKWCRTFNDTYQVLQLFIMRLYIINLDMAFSDSPFLESWSIPESLPDKKCHVISSPNFYMRPPATYPSSPIFWESSSSCYGLMYNWTEHDKYIM